jgi:hypothetical protein
MTYINGKSKNKEISRQHILDIVGDRKGLDIFTLPSTNFLLENRLDAHNITCAERDLDICVDQKLIVKAESKENIDINYGDAFEVLRESKKAYDVIWLDLCGPLSSPLINNFLSAIQMTPLKRVTHISLTFAGARGYYAKDIARFYNAKNIEDFRTRVFPKLVSDFAAQAGRKCELIYKQAYKEDRRAIPMKMYTFKIEQI